MPVPNLQLVQTDITKIETDIIVNAANSALSGGGGVDGAIHRAAGPKLLEACRQFERCPPGSSVLTPAYDLPAKWVVHAVGPVWDGGNRGEEALLGDCYSSVMSYARDKQASSIAFPAISCGAYRFPHDKAAKIAISTIYRASVEWQTAITVFLCCFDASVYRAYGRVLSQHGLR